MFRVGTNIIGVGSLGARTAEYAIESGISGARYATVMGDCCGKAEFRPESKDEFVRICHRMFVTPGEVAFVLADTGDRVAAALACEICAVTQAMESFTVAVVYVPSSTADNYNEAMSYVDELHGVASGVVVINRGYAPDFCREVCMLLDILSDAMDSSGAKRISGNSDLKAIFDTERNIYFAAVESDIQMDSHGYMADSLSMKLDCQTHIDIASNITYFVSCGSQMPKELVSRYVNAVDKKNIAYMAGKRAYIYENNPRLANGSFMFGVLCSL